MPGSRAFMMLRCALGSRKKAGVMNTLIRVSKSTCQLRTCCRSIDQRRRPRPCRCTMAFPSILHLPCGTGAWASTAAVKAARRLSGNLRPNVLHRLTPSPAIRPGWLGFPNLLFHFLWNRGSGVSLDGFPLAFAFRTFASGMWGSSCTGHRTMWPFLIHKGPKTWSPSSLSPLLQA